jgi:rRNA maturation endonuclease Nob1
MRYLLDTNSLSKDVLDLASKRADFFVIRDVLDELPTAEEDQRRIRAAKVNILEVEPKHLAKLLEVMNKYGDDLKLVRLYTGEGTADVVMLAYVLADREASHEKLFYEEWTLVTDDAELRRVSAENGIASMSRSELLAGFS